MPMDALQRDQIVFHKTFGPGRVISASSTTIDVEFHDGRRESFRRSSAGEKLLLCSQDGFSARLLADKHAVLRTLEESPREVFKWLSQDLNQEITARTAKPRLKSLNMVPQEELEAVWRRATQRLKRQPPKQRVVDDTLRIAGENEAREFESKLWDTQIHIESRNIIYRVLSDFYDRRSNEDFYLRVLFCPVPVARAHAYGSFKKRGKLREVWDYLVRKSADQRSAPGMLDIWFRLIGDSSQEEVRAYGEIAVDIFLQLQTALLVRGERLDNIRKLLAPQTGTAFSISKAVVGRLPRHSWGEVLPELTSEEKQRGFQLYFQAAVHEPDDGAAVEGILDFLSYFDVQNLADLVLTVADFASMTGRTALVRRFLRASAEVIVRHPEIHDPGLRRVRDWLLRHREIPDAALADFFLKLGYPLEETPAKMDRSAHIRRIEDASLPRTVRERSMEEVAPELPGEEMAALVRKLTVERASSGRQLVAMLWSRWIQSRESADVLHVLMTILLSEEDGQSARSWAVATASEGGLLQAVAESLCQRIRSRRLSEPVDPGLRALLTEVREQALGKIIRDKLLKERLQIAGSSSRELSQAIGDALTLLGVDPDLYAFMENVIEAGKREIDNLTVAVGRLDEKLEDILSSAEVKSEIRRLVDESLGAREVQLREGWDRGRETARLEVASFYLDLTAFVNSVRASLGEDTGAVADILIRRLEQLLSSRLDMMIVGRIGDTVRFDPDLHESAVGSIAEGEKVMILRPGIRKIGSSGVVSKAMVKRQ